MRSGYRRAGSRLTGLLLLTLSATTSTAQPPPPQPDMQAIYQQMPHLEGMQAVQEKHERLKQERKAERKATTDAIYAEELEKARNAPEAANPMYDPYAAAEWAAKQRIEPLAAEWKQEDQALEQQMHQEMMNSTGMGDMLKMQQQMLQGQGQ